ncbi:MAG TPA: protoporphyrin IX magnesium chelatase, partial [Porphyromonadaceae bacterium]|nr:protoporphyrin IX magnesium chelatase [Porphyromonadaceae bacterium]
YSIAKLDLLNNKISLGQYENNTFITQKYLHPVKARIRALLTGRSFDTNPLYDLAQLSDEDRQKAQEINAKLHPREMSMASMMNAPEEDKDFCYAVLEIEETIRNVLRYKTLLEESPEAEMSSLLNALSGGYIAPSPGGDAVRSPNTLPTGRNLYSINAEATPSLRAWDNGKSLVEATLAQYKKKHNRYPRKVSYTFWAGEFIESEGATLAQALYMVGVEPVRDRMNRVTDLRLIPSNELGRPRIDIVVQTSGQLRDLAASRLLLLTKAVSMAAHAKDDAFDNYVAEGTVASEKGLVDKGVSPQQARELSTMRVFGGINGHYGTGIMQLVEQGDAWENTSEIAETYIHNMGAIYGDDKNWGAFKKDLFEVALQQTDIVVQPRQNNTWGALTLDHVYEFMGGVNLAVKTVTGKEPDTYLSDYRNRNKVRMQELKEAIGVESRTTLLNPAYIKEKMKGGSSSAQVFVKTFTNTYAWNVMKPEVIDNDMWNRLYDVYVKDAYGLGVEGFFAEQNPAAMQDITAVMMETARKGLWQANEEQLQTIADVHIRFVRQFGASGSDFSGSNHKVQDFISQHAAREDAAGYKRRLQQMKTPGAATELQGKGTVLKKESLSQPQPADTKSLDTGLIVALVLVLFVGVLIALRRKRK